MNTDDAAQPRTESHGQPGLRTTANGPAETATLLLRKSIVSEHSRPVASTPLNTPVEQRRAESHLWIAAGTVALLCLCLVLSDLTRLVRGSNDGVLHSSVAISERDIPLEAEVPSTATAIAVEQQAKDAKQVEQELETVHLRINGLEASVSDLRKSFDVQNRELLGGEQSYYSIGAGELLQEEVAAIRTRLTNLEGELAALRAESRADSTAAAQNTSEHKTAESNGFQPTKAKAQKQKPTSKLPKPRRGSTKSKPLVQAKGSLARSMPDPTDAADHRW